MLLIPSWFPCQQLSQESLQMLWNVVRLVYDTNVQLVADQSRQQVPMKQNPLRWKTMKNALPSLVLRSLPILVVERSFGLGKISPKSPRRFWAKLDSKTNGIHIISFRHHHYCGREHLSRINDKRRHSFGSISAPTPQHTHTQSLALGVVYDMSRTQSKQSRPIHCSVFTNIIYLYVPPLIQFLCKSIHNIVP